jgi:O-antigen/teichoic acid export membrane protein
MVVYGVLGFLRPAIYILLFPFYTGQFSTDEFGLYNLMLDVGAFAMIIVSFRISSAMLTYYYNYVHDRKLVKEYLSSAFSASIFLGIVMVMILYFLGPVLFPIIFKSEAVTFFPYGITVIIYAAMTEVGTVYMTYLKNEKDIVKYSLLILIQLITVVFFQVLLVKFYGMGVYGALLGMVIGWSIVLLSIFIIERGIFTLRINKSMVSTSLKFSFALIPYIAIYWLLLQGGRIFLERNAPNEDDSSLGVVGVFAAMMVVSRLIILGIESVVNGVRPFLFDQFALGKNGDVQQISLLTKMIIIIPLITVPVVILVGTNILLFTTNMDYQTIAPYMTFASLVIFFFIYVKLFYQQLIFAKRSDLATILSFVALVFLIGGFIYWIPLYEIWGVLYATLMANVVLASLFYIAAQQVTFVQYDFKTIIFYPLIVFGLIFIIEWLMLRSGYSYSAFGIVQCIIVSILIIVMNKNNFKDYKLLFMNRNKSKSL